MSARVKKRASPSLIAPCVLKVGAHQIV
jgi:hypothetical protein